MKLPAADVPFTEIDGIPCYAPAFDILMRVDAALIAMGLALPMGGALLAVARKPGE